MGKLDGMDPKLVRDLLSEVRQAAEQMRTAEGRVARLMSAAGLSSQSTHRPSQVADACEEMVRDVSARVELLERKVKQEGASQPGPKIGEPKAETPKVADARGEAPQAEETKDKDAKAETPKVADARGEASKPETSHDSGARPDTPKAEDLKPAVRPEGGGQHDGGQQGGGQSAGNAPEDGRKPHSPPDTKPDTGSDPKPDSKPENGSKGEETSPRDGHSGSDGSKDRGADSGGSGKDTDAKGHSSAKVDADPKGDAGSKGDERSPRDGHSGSDGSKDRGADSGGPGKDTDAKGHSSAKVDADLKDTDLKGDTGSKGDETSPRGDGKIEILDTFRKDHPDDIDQTGGSRPQVVEVHGVKMLQIPLDSPSAAEVGELLKHVEDLPLLDDPSVVTSADLLTDGGSGVDGAGSDRPGQVEPNEALKSVKPAFPVPDTAEPALDQGGRPPGTGGETVSPLVGTPFDDTGTHSGGTHSAGTHSTGTHSGGAHSTGTHSTGGTHVTGGTAEGVLAQWAEDGDAGSAQAGPVSPDASATFADSGYRAGPPYTPDGPDVLLRAGETGDEGVWSTADAGSGDAADDVDSGDSPRSAPPSGGGRSGGTE
ncbi:hypothetical protein [Streptosporangium sp. NPDC004631]